MADSERRFTTRLQSLADRRIGIVLPFDPNATWGQKARHHVRGTLNGLLVRGPVEPEGRAWALRLGPAWRRDAGLGVDDEVDVWLAPEGPQADALAADLASALDAEPAARRFFDSLATFYRKGYIDWIDATKRRPEERARRILQVVELLKASRKQR